MSLFTYCELSGGELAASAERQGVGSNGASTSRRFSRPSYDYVKPKGSPLWTSVPPGVEAMAAGGIPCHNQLTGYSPRNGFISAGTGWTLTAGSGTAAMDTAIYMVDSSVAATPQSLKLVGGAPNAPTAQSPNSLDVATVTSLRLRTWLRNDDGAASDVERAVYSSRRGAWMGTSTDEDVTWTNVVGGTASGNSFTKTAATGWGNSGASSVETIVSGDGYVEAIAEASPGSYAWMIGLSTTDTDQDYTTVNFGLLQSFGTFIVYENGVLKGTFGAISAGDALRVAVIGGVVKYLQNGVVIYTSATAPTYPLLCDMCCYQASSVVNNVAINRSTSTSRTSFRSLTPVWADVGHTTGDTIAFYPHEEIIRKGTTLSPDYLFMMYRENSGTGKTAHVGYASFDEMYLDGYPAVTSPDIGLPSGPPFFQDALTSAATRYRPEVRVHDEAGVCATDAGTLFFSLTPDFASTEYFILPIVAIGNLLGTGAPGIGHLQVFYRPYVAYLYIEANPAGTQRGASLALPWASTLRVAIVYSGLTRYGTCGPMSIAAYGNGAFLGVDMYPLSDGVELFAGATPKDLWIGASMAWYPDVVVSGDISDLRLLPYPLTSAQCIELTR